MEAHLRSKERQPARTAFARTRTLLALMAVLECAGMRLLLAAGATAAVAATLAQPAQGSEVGRFLADDQRTSAIEYHTFVTGLPGEANDISITYDPAGRVYVIEDKVGITIRPPQDPAGPGCVVRNRTTVACSWSSIGSVVLGDGNDRVAVTSAAAPDTVRVERQRGSRTYTVSAPRGIRAEGGRGNDVLIGNAGADQLLGGPGDDTVDGGEGPDELVGFDDSDRIAGGGGDDMVAGATGDDVVDGGDGDDDLE
jgi:hypothetical protein